MEPALTDTPLGEVVQFERLGYFAHDPDTPMLFHRAVGLRDEWANIQKRRPTRVLDPIIRSLLSHSSTDCLLHTHQLTRRDLTK